MEKQICNPSKLPNHPSHILSMHKNSQAISKSKPKIRIIHIFAPEIIKTDAANFRELVQRLTGKPTDDEKDAHRNKREKRRFDSEELRERIKGEEEIWSGANSGGGFLGGFGDQFEFGLLQEIDINGNNDNNCFPFLEGTTPQIMGGFGENVQFVANYN